MADAQRAVESLNGKQLCNRALDVRLGAPSGGVHRSGHPGAGFGATQQAPSGGVGEPTPSPNLYIKGLPPGTTDVGLRNVFVPFGTILDSRILYPESSAPSALLRYTTVQEAAAAIAAMHGVTPPGAVNMLQVKYAESAADKARRAAQVGARPGGLPGQGVSRVGTVHLPFGVEAIEKVECPPPLVGWLIGRSGETIKNLQLRSGCVISIDQTMADGQPRIVNIAGTREQATLGKQLVEELLASGAARSGSSFAPSSGQGGFGGSGPFNTYAGNNDQSYHHHRGPPPPLPPPMGFHAPTSSIMPVAQPLALPAPPAPEAEEPDPCVFSTSCYNDVRVLLTSPLLLCLPTPARRRRMMKKTATLRQERQWNAKTTYRPPFGPCWLMRLCLKQTLCSPRSTSR